MYADGFKDDRNFLILVGEIFCLISDYEMDDLGGVLVDEEVGAKMTIRIVNNFC